MTAQTLPSDVSDEDSIFIRTPETIEDADLFEVSKIGIPTYKTILESYSKVSRQWKRDCKKNCVYLFVNQFIGR